MKNRLKGLIAAVFTPMNPDGSVNTGKAKPIVEFLIGNKINGLYVCGSTGEGPLLTSNERRQTAEAYVEAVSGRIPVIIQVGHDSLAEARQLAAHAQSIGADAIASIPSTYFKVNSVKGLVDCFEQIVAGAPELPFFYYHIPQLTGINLDMVDFLIEGGRRLPTLHGIKYSALTVFELQSCIEFQNGKYTVLFGCDEMLLSGLCAGAPGAVGSTFNFAAPIYNRIIDAYQKGDIAEARKWQSRSVNMVRLLVRYRGQPAFKAIMKFMGLDCGPNRLPLQTLSSGEVASMKKGLEELGFFNWIAGKD